MAVHMLPGTGYDCNIYVVSGDRPVVVDAGSGVRVARAVERIKKFIGDRKVSAVVLTHRHYDHVGGAAALSQALGAPVYAHRLDSAPIREGSSRGTEALSLMNVYDVDAVEVLDLEGGEILSTGEHELRVLHTPGHTVGGICLYDQEKKILLSGDTVFAGGVGRWDLATGNHADLVASVKMLDGLGPNDLYPGHGPSAVGDAREQLKDALRYLGEC